MLKKLLLLISLLTFTATTSTLAQTTPASLPNGIFNSITVGGFTINQIASMATQAANNVNITGGTIANASVDLAKSTVNGVTQSMSNWLISFVPHVANNSALSTFNGKLVVIRDGFSVVGDGGRALYIYSSSPCANADGGSQIASNLNGGCWNIDWSSVGNIATPELFAGLISVPATPTGENNYSGAGDAKPALQAAVNTGKSVRLAPNSDYYVKSQITINTSAQQIYGAGRTSSRIIYDSAFSTANGPSIIGVNIGTGGLNYNTGQPGPILHDFHIKGFQPEVNAPANNPQQTVAYLKANPSVMQAQLNSLVQVSCIDIRNVIASKIYNMMITTCMRGIDMRGNTGQTVIDDVQGSNFIADIDIDGALDTVRINNVHTYPFNITTNQYYLIDANAVAIQSGRMDDLKISNSMAIAANIGWHFYQGSVRTLANDGYDSPGGITTGASIDYDFDTIPLGVYMEAGSFTLTGGYFASQQDVYITNGNLNISNTTTPVNTDNIIVIGSGLSGSSPYVTIQNMTFNDPNTTYTPIVQNNGVFMFNNNLYAWGSNSSLTKSKVHSICCRFVAHDNFAFDFSYSGSPQTQTSNGSFFQVDSDNNYNSVVDNFTPGWVNLFPSNPVNGQYWGNTQGIFTSPNGAKIGKILQLPAYTVSTLPTCNSSNLDAVVVASDAASPIYRGALTGGGSVRTIVECDGTSWTSH